MHKPDLRQVREGELLDVGPWGLEFFAVNHSIPDALAVAIRAGGQTVLHTGDFKMDQTPLDGRLTDLNGFSRLGDEGVDLLLADSTNAEVGGFIPSERDVGLVVADVIAKAQGRIIVACFASHVHRVQQVLDAAVAAERHVALVGRSMVRNMQIARELGLLQRAGRPARRPQGRRGTAVAARPAHLDRVAGRAAVGAVADGQPRSPDRADRLRRHDPAGLVADPGQRDVGRAGDQRAVPARRDRGAQVDGAGARVRARAGRRAALPAQRGPSAQPHAGARRVAAPARARRDRAGRPASRTSGSCSPRTAPSSTWSTASRRISRQDPGRLRVRRRARGRRHRRRDAQGPAHPRRGGLPVDPRRRRSRGRQGRVRAGDHRARLQRRPARRSIRSAPS